MDEQLGQNIDWQDIINKDGFLISANISGLLAATATNYGLFFTALYPCEILAISEVHQTAGSGSGTLDVEKLTGTQALDSGSVLLSTPTSLTSTANTVVYPSMTTTYASRRMVKGDRLALKDGGTLTNVAGVQVTIYGKRLGRGHYAAL